MRWSESDLAAYLARQRPARALGTDAEEQEKHFQARVIAEAKRCGWLCHWTHDSRRSPEGWPDLVLCKPPTAHDPHGHLLICELKSATGKCTPAQARWLAVLATVPGVRACVWTPQDWADILTTLEDPVNYG